MSGKRVKSIRRQMRKQRDKIGRQLIENTMQQPLKDRLFVAWKIVRGRL